MSGVSQKTLSTLWPEQALGLVSGCSLLVGGRELSRPVGPHVAPTAQGIVKEAHFSSLAWNARIWRQKE